MRSICGLDFLQVGDAIWISAMDRNGLFQYDLINEEMAFKGVFPGENMWASNLHCSILEWCEHLIFVPSMAKHIALYDLKTGVIDFINLPRDIEMKDHKFGYAVIWKNKLFLLGDQVTDIYILDLNTKKYRKLNSIQLIIKTKYKGMPYISADYVIMDEFIFLITRHSGAVYKINMDTETMQEYWISDANGGHALLCHDGKNFWCLENFEFELRCWNEKNGVIEKVKIPRGLYDEGGTWTESIYFEGKILLFQAQNIVFFDPNKKKFVSLQESDLNLVFDSEQRDTDLDHHKYTRKIFAGRQIGNSLFFLTDRGKVFRVRQNHTIEEAGIFCSVNWLMEEKIRWMNQIGTQQIINEQNECPIEIFMEYVKMANVFQKVKRSEYGKLISKELLERNI